ncbi:hypothetical protein BJ165DRAFT_1413058 [Panaeolus papilionaceus]|nr:hypothetical protein BJ165DRAFT_1413058 [Panaeolus papilionaceus]
MISRCRAKITVIQLTEVRGSRGNSLSQRGLKGNIVVFPQSVETIASILPPNLSELSAPMCVIFIGSSQPLDQWILQKAKPLLVRPHQVHLALEWLRMHNSLYSNIEINEELLISLPDEHYLPVTVHRYHNVLPALSLMSRYELSHVQSNARFERLCVPDLTVGASPAEIRAAAAQHLKTGKPFVQISHDEQPSNEFNNPYLFPMLYPTLYPFGLGGFENHKHTTPLAIDKQIRALLQRHNTAFQMWVLMLKNCGKVMIFTILLLKRNLFPNYYKKSM